MLESDLTQFDSQEQIKYADLLTSLPKQLFGQDKDSKF